MKEEERMGQRTLSTETVSPPLHPSSQPNAGTEMGDTAPRSSGGPTESFPHGVSHAPPPAELPLLIILSRHHHHHHHNAHVRSETSVSAGPVWIDGSLGGEKLRAKIGNTRQQQPFGLADERERTWRMREEE